MRRGEIYRQGHRVLLVVTADEHCVNAPFALEIVRGGIDFFPYSLALAEVDPISGYVLTDFVHSLVAAELSGPECLVSGATMHRVGEALRELFEL